MCAASFLIPTDNARKGQTLRDTPSGGGQGNSSSLLPFFVLFSSVLSSPLLSSAHLFCLIPFFSVLFSSVCGPLISCPVKACGWRILCESTCTFIDSYSNYSIEQNIYIHTGWKSFGNHFVMIWFQNDSWCIWIFSSNFYLFQNSV